MDTSLPSVYNGYDLMGKQKLPNGMNPLKRLQPIHKHIIALHLQGMKNRDIQSFLSQAGAEYTVVRISHIITDPLSRQVIDTFNDQVDQDLKTLEIQAVDVLKDAMTNGSMDQKLRGADKILRANGRFADKTTSAETAEDVIARVLELASQSMETVKEVVRTRPKMIDITPDREATD